MAVHAERLDEHRARLDPEFVQPGGLGSARAVERDGLARRGRAPRARCPATGMIRTRTLRLAAGGRHAQLAALLDHDEQRARIEQREPAVGHQPQQPQL